MNDLGGKSYEPETPATSDERTLALLAQILGLFTCFIGPGIIWLVKKDQSDFIRRHCLQAIIWQVAIGVVANILGLITCGIGYVLYIVDILYVVIACIRANEGKVYEYPLVGGLLK